MSQKIVDTHNDVTSTGARQRVQLDFTPEAFARLQEVKAAALAAIIIEQPESYRTAILATRAPLIRSFIRRFDTHA
jgi:hypothetical protein